LGDRRKRKKGVLKKTGDKSKQAGKTLEKKGRRRTHGKKKLLWEPGGKTLSGGGERGLTPNQKIKGNAGEG